MSKIEDLILAELRRAVFEKDKTIKQRHEEEELKNATKEALAEMTDLSIHEINKLETKVRLDLKKRKEKKKLRITFFMILTIPIIGFLYYFLFPFQYNDKLVFVEEFDNNSNGWFVYDDFRYQSYVENGKYFFISNREDSCYDDEIAFILPKQFTIELKSTWISGQYNPYGLKLYLNYDRSNLFFRLNPPNTTSIHRSHSTHDFGNWIEYESLSNNPKHQHIQKIVVKPFPWKGGNHIRSGKYSYYVDGQLIKEDTYVDRSVTDNLDFPQPELLFSVSGKQKVSFDHIMIRDDQAGKVVLQGTFGDIKDRLQTKTSADSYSFIDKGNYVFKTEKENQCYYSVIHKVIKRHSKVRLNSRWVSGDNYYYGLIIKTADENEFYAFEIKPDGKACFIKSINGKNEVFIDNLETGIKSVHDKIINQTVLFKGRTLEYYIDDKLVYSGKNDLKDLFHVGLRVCGKQTVSFDMLEIRE